MGYLSTDKKKITTKTYAEMKAAGEKVTMLTAYDFTTAGIMHSCSVICLSAAIRFARKMPCAMPAE